MAEDPREARLAALGALIAEAETLKPERNRLILELAAEGRSHGRLARLARVSRGRVQQIRRAAEGGPAPGTPPPGRTGRGPAGRSPAA